MTIPFKNITLATALLMISYQGYAKPPSGVEQLQLTECLAEKLPKAWPVIAEHNSFKIIEIPSDQFNTLHAIADKSGCGFFVNVTSELEQSSLPAKRKTALRLLRQPAPLLSEQGTVSYEIKHEESVKQAINKVEPENIWKTLTHLTSYKNRSARQAIGEEAIQWVSGEFNKMAKETGRDDIQTFMVPTSGYRQPSLVTIIGNKLEGPGVVVGAHIDTLDGTMPGAGDDGSGSSTTMEVARILMNPEIKLKRPVYVIWYAAEERGLVGSADVVRHFTKQSIPVKAVIQFDMTGYRNDMQDQTMWVFRDYTDKQLSDFTSDLIKHYIKVPVSYSKCGYGCSDHASWHKIKVPAVFPCETSFEEHNPYIHTSKDTMDRLSLEHMTNFAKLGLAFAIELASE